MIRSCKVFRHLKRYSISIEMIVAFNINYL